MKLPGRARIPHVAASRRGGRLFSRSLIPTELVARAHAGALSQQQTEQVLEAVRRDPAALDRLADLDEVSDELRRLGDEDALDPEVTQAPPMPAALSARLESALGIGPEQPTRSATIHQIGQLGSAAGVLPDAESMSAVSPPRSPLLATLSRWREHLRIGLR